MHLGRARFRNLQFQTDGCDPQQRGDLRRQGHVLAGGDGARLAKNDSVFVTLTIDPVALSVGFQPTGVLFSIGSPASLTLWYGNANPDLNRDGVVDATDQALKQQLAIWYNVGQRHTPWFKLSSNRDTTQPFIVTALYHFSYYAVSW